MVTIKILNTQNPALMRRVGHNMEYHNEKEIKHEQKS